MELEVTKCTICVCVCDIKEMYVTIVYTAHTVHCIEFHMLFYIPSFVTEVILSMYIFYYDAEVVIL